MELERKREFLAIFQRWERLFKRRDGEANAEKWLIAEYYDSLGHLSADGLAALTKLLKSRCTFFPTIAECLAAMKCDPYDWGNPFRGGGRALTYAGEAMALAGPAHERKQIAHG